MNFTLVNKTCLLVGKRGSGKTVLMKHLIECEYQDFDKIFLFCPTSDLNDDFKELIPETCTFKEYDDDWVIRLMDSCAEQIKKGKAKKKILLILDDIATDNKLKKDNDGFTNVFTRGRHLGLSIILTSQYLNTLLPIVRSNCDYIFVSKLNNYSLKLLTEEYKNGDLSNKEFEALYYDSTKDYKFLVINNTCTENNNIEELYGSIKVNI